MHDIGGHISYLDHHRHSYYLIHHGGLRGFDPEEVEAIALMARYHRRGRPKKSNRDVGALSAATRRAVRFGAAMLRLAESLDWSHGQLVDQVELRTWGDRLQLRLRAHGPVELERWAAARHTDPLSRLLGKAVAIDTPYEDDAQHVDDAPSVPRPPHRRRGHRRVR